MDADHGDEAVREDIADSSAGLEIFESHYGDPVSVLNMGPRATLRAPSRGSEIPLGAKSSAEGASALLDRGTILAFRLWTPAVVKPAGGGSPPPQTEVPPSSRARLWHILDPP